MTPAKLIPDDIREIINSELPSYWLEEKSNKVNDYVNYGGIFDIGITPNHEVHSILRLNHHKVKPTPEMKEYLKSVYEKAINLSSTLYSKSQWVQGSGESNDFRTLSVKPRVWKELVTQKHKDKIFDPRNYEVTIKAMDHPILDKLDIYKQIFGKVKAIRIDGTEI